MPDLWHLMAVCLRNTHVSARRTRASLKDCGRKAREFLEVVHQVRLVAVTTGLSHIRPIDIVSGRKLFQHPREAAQSAIELRRCSYLLAKQLAKAAAAQPGLLHDIEHLLHMRHAPKLAQPAF